MSKITAIYDALHTQIAALFTTKTLLPNPYSPEDNASHDLVNGYGILVGPENFEEHDFCSMMNNRTFSVVLTHENVKLQSETAESNTVSKLFLEEVYQIRNLLYSYNELGINDDIAAVNLLESSGIERVSGEKDNILKMTVSFVFKVREPI